MATGHRVTRPRDARLALPRILEPLSSRSYRDRFGVEYEVVWNGHRDDPDLLAPYNTTPRPPGDDPW